MTGMESNETDQRNKKGKLGIRASGAIGTSFHAKVTFHGREESSTIEAVWSIERGVVSTLLEQCLTLLVRGTLQKSSMYEGKDEPSGAGFQREDPHSLPP